MWIHNYELHLNFNLEFKHLTQKEPGKVESAILFYQELGDKGLSLWQTNKGFCPQFSLLIQSAFVHP